MKTDPIQYHPRKDKWFCLLNVARDRRVRHYEDTKSAAEIAWLAHSFPQEVLITAAEHALTNEELERRDRRYRRYVNRKKLEEKAAPLWT